MTSSLAIGLDAGGTKVAGLVVDAHGTIVERRLAETPADDAEAAVRTLVALARELMADHPAAAAVGVGAAGMVSLDGAMRFAPNIAWAEFPLRERLARGIGLPVLVDNDANMAAWGEFRFGAGRGSSDMLLVTVGTGLGGGIVAGGRLYRGAHGFAAEIGHVIVDPNGPRCGCGNLGCWEQVASGRALGRLGKESGRDHPESLMVQLAGGDPELVTGPIVTDAAQRGDVIAVHVLDEVGRRLGQGIAGLVNVLDPEVVVVGGGVVQAGDLLLEPARTAFVGAVEGAEHRPAVPIRAAQLGNDAGAVGAADLALLEFAGVA
ncbi:MAG TPA: ROK family glucokinase [Actinomycetota bacterium]|jgi:glucokinase